MPTSKTMDTLDIFYDGSSTYHVLCNLSSNSMPTQTFDIKNNVQIDTQNNWKLHLLNPNSKFSKLKVEVWPHFKKLQVQVSVILLQIIT